MSKCIDNLMEACQLRVLKNVKEIYTLEGEGGECSEVRKNMGQRRVKVMV